MDAFVQELISIPKWFVNCLIRPYPGNVYKMICVQVQAGRPNYLDRLNLFCVRFHNQAHEDIRSLPVAAR
jgi:hypothetical protein